MSGSSEFLYILIPCVIAVLLLKFCLIFCRAYYYYKRRERQAQLLQEQRRMQVMASLRAQQARSNVVRITATRRASCPGVGTRPPGWVRPAAAGPCTVIISSDQLRRVLNPNIPPSYDQAVTGKDKSIKLEEGMAKAQGPAATEAVVLDDSPPAYTPGPESTCEFPLTSPTPLPTYSSHVSDEGNLDDDEPLLT